MTDISGVFYCTEDMKDWLCEECFNEFKDEYNWQAKDASNYKIKIDDPSKLYYIVEVKDD